MLESASMAFILGLTIAFLGLSCMVLCLGIFAARVNEHLNELDANDAFWRR